MSARPGRSVAFVGSVATGKIDAGCGRHEQATAVVRLIDADSIRARHSAVVMRPAAHTASIQEHGPETDRGAERRVAEQHDPQQPRSFTAAKRERAETP